MTADAGPSDAGPSDAGPPDAGRDAGVVIAFDALQSWTRHPDPVFRDPLVGYEVAADPHVIFDAQGALRMFYSGDVGGYSSIKMTEGRSPLQWSTAGPAISGPAVGLDRERETSFYRRARDGTHQIYFIGYQDVATYRSQVYRAEAATIEGPYQIDPTPVVALGELAGHEVSVLTSPSVVDHDGMTYLLVLGWDAPGDQVTAVWVIGATSRDDGRTFSSYQEVAAPIGMEGQVTPGPDGLFYATASVDVPDGPDLITLGRAAHPFGPYEMLPRPVITQGGEPYEVDEANAAMIAFDPARRTAHLFWHGANYFPDAEGAYAGGYWIMTASTSY